MGEIPAKVTWHNKCADCDQDARVGVGGVAHFEARLNDVVSTVTQAWERRDG